MARGLLKKAWFHNNKNNNNINSKYRIPLRKILIIPIFQIWLAVSVVSYLYLTLLVLLIMKSSATAKTTKRLTSKQMRMIKIWISYILRLSRATISIKSLQRKCSCLILNSFNWINIYISNSNKLNKKLPSKNKLNNNFPIINKVI